MALEEEYVKKKLKKLKKDFPGMDIEKVERELFPLKGEEIHVVTKKKQDEEEE